MISWLLVITGAGLLFVGSLCLVRSCARRQPYVSPDPLGCCDCGIVCELNMWHRCQPCNALLKITDPRSPEVVDWVYQKGLRS